jgi:hypothetical protein
MKIKFYGKYRLVIEESGNVSIYFGKHFLDKVNNMDEAYVKCEAFGLDV